MGPSREAEVQVFLTVQLQLVEERRVEVALIAAVEIITNRSGSAMKIIRLEEVDMRPEGGASHLVAVADMQRRRWISSSSDLAVRNLNII